MATYCVSNFVKDPSVDDRLIYIYNCNGQLTATIDPYASTFFQKSRYVYIVTDGKMNYDTVLDFDAESDGASAVCRLNDVKKYFIDKTNADLAACGNVVRTAEFVAHTGDTTIHFTAESLSGRYYSISGGTIYGDVIPDGDGVRSLGSTDYQWKDIWVSGGTIYLEQIPLTTDGVRLLWNGATIEGNPAGLHGEIQINSGDTFATSSNLKYDFDNNTLNINGDLNISGDTKLNTLTLQSGVTIYGISTSSTLTENSNSYLATQGAVKSYVDAQIGSENYWDVVGDTLIPESAYTNLFIPSAITATTFIGSNLEITTATELNTLSLQSGATIYGISTDSGLTEDSDSYLSTQKAIKDYVDSQISGENYWDASGDTLLPESGYNNLYIPSAITATTYHGSNLILGDCEASGLKTLAGGYFSIASGMFSIAYGQAAKSIGNESFAFGDNVETNGISSFGVGANNKTYGNYSFVEGYTNIASGQSSHAEGENNNSYGQSSHVEGEFNNTYGRYSHSEGYYNNSYGLATHTEGRLNNAWGDYSHAQNYENTANGHYSHVEGYGCITNGEASHAQGYRTKSDGIYSHSMGYSTNAIGDYSFAGGKGYGWEDPTQHYIISSGISSFNFSYMSISGVCSGATGNYSTILGGDLQSATGNYSAILGGKNNSATGEGSVVLGGEGNIASGNYSTAFGFNTTASGNYSTASGYHSMSEGFVSTASGYYTVASGDYSTTSGKRTTANGYVSTDIILLLLVIIQLLLVIIHLLVVMAIHQIIKLLL